MTRAYTFFAALLTLIVALSTACQELPAPNNDSAQASALSPQPVQATPQTASPHHPGAGRATNLAPVPMPSFQDEPQEAPVPVKPAEPKKKAPTVKHTPAKDDRGPAEAHSNLRLDDFAVATNVVKRVPQGVDDTFDVSEGTLWGYVKVRNTQTPTHVTMVWKRNGVLRTRIDVKVGTSPGWRTWSRQRIRPQRDAGRWTLEVFTADGDLLGARTFDVVKAADPQATAELEEVPGC